MKNLEENIGAAQVKLTQEEVQEMREACENTNILEARYPATSGATKIFRPMGKLLIYRKKIMDKIFVDGREIFYLRIS